MEFGQQPLSLIQPILITTVSILCCWENSLHKSSQNSLETAYSESGNAISVSLTLFNAILSALKVSNRFSESILVRVKHSYNSEFKKKETWPGGVQYHRTILCVICWGHDKPNRIIVSFKKFCSCSCSVRSRREAKNEFAGGFLIDINTSALCGGRMCCFNDKPFDFGPNALLQEIVSGLYVVLKHYRRAHLGEWVGQRVGSKVDHHIQPFKYSC